MPPNMASILEPVLSSGLITEGPKAKEFQEKFQEYIGNPFTALTNSATSAIVIALRLAGVSPGDEVITSPMTCLATNEPILLAGVVPVWCDVDIRTGNIDPSKIECLITSRTKAIVFVDWAGTPPEIDEINAIAKKHNLKTIEDAAHALGAKYKGRKVGTLSDFTCFSFQAIKHLTTVDGGAIACKVKEDYERAILLRWFGMARGHNAPNQVKWDGDIIEPGYKMHMNDLNAAIGIEQLKYIEKNISLHHENGMYLRKHLKYINGLELCDIPSYIKSSFWIFTLKLENIEKKTSFSNKLLKTGIGNGLAHTRNDTYSLFKNYQCSLPALDKFSECMLNIPCGWWVEKSDLDYIISTIKKISND